MPELIARVQRAAPQVRIAVRASDALRGTGMLENDEMDLGVSVFPDGPSWQRREQLASMAYRCVYDGKRLGIDPRLTLEQYLAHPHLVTPTQTDFRGAVDDELVGRSRGRSIIYTTSRFAALPLILRRAAVIATVPEQSAQHWAEAYGLTSSPVPVRIAPLAISMIWHAKREGTPASNGCAALSGGSCKASCAQFPRRPRLQGSVAGATMAGEGRAQPTEMRPRSGGAADGTAEERLIFRRGAIRRNPRL
jgi:LysR family transcriptional regulator, mexEF-oprN operon transcriptional activator